MTDLDFEQLGRGAAQYMCNHLDPSFTKKYDDDEIFLYMMDLCNDYTETRGDDEEVCLDLSAIATYVSDHLSQDMGVEMHKDDAYDLVSTLYDYYAKEGLVGVIDTDEGQE